MVTLPVAILFDLEDSSFESKDVGLSSSPLALI